MKYIRTESHGFIMFAEWINHVDMARSICGPYVDEEVISAGFVNMSSDAECYGKSVSLGKSVVDEDTNRLREQVRSHI